MRVAAIAACDRRAFLPADDVDQRRRLEVSERAELPFDSEKPGHRERGVPLGVWKHVDQAASATRQVTALSAGPSPGPVARAPQRFRSVRCSRLASGARSEGRSNSQSDRSMHSILRSETRSAIQPRWAGW